MSGSQKLKERLEKANKKLKEIKELIKCDSYYDGLCCSVCEHFGNDDDYFCYTRKILQIIESE